MGVLDLNLESLWVRRWLSLLFFYYNPDILGANDKFMVKVREVWLSSIEDNLCNYKSCVASPVMKIPAPVHGFLEKSRPSLSHFPVTCYQEETRI